MFKMFRILSVIVILFGFCLQNCLSTSSRRSLPLLSSGIHWSTVYDEPNGTGAAAAGTAFGDILSAGLSAYQLGLTWDAFESGDNPGVINTDLLSFYLNILDSLNLQAMVGLSLINTNVLSIPTDLIDSSNSLKLADGMDFMSNEFYTRYRNLLDELVPVIDNYNGFYIVLANEFDIYLYDVIGSSGSLSSYKDSFTQLMINMSDYIHNTLNYNQIAVGITSTHDGFIDYASQNHFSELLDSLDVVSLTYYPLQSNFYVKNPHVVYDDIMDIVDIIPDNMPLIIQEFGYPSGYLPSVDNTNSTNNSSESKQNQFYLECNETFVPLIKSNKLRVASAFKLIDWSEPQCDAFEEYYGLENDQFKEYLCTLGLYTYGGTEKQAFDTLIAMMQQEYDYDNVSYSYTTSDAGVADSTTSTSTDPTTTESGGETGGSVRVYPCIMSSINVLLAAFVQFFAK